MGGDEERMKREWKGGCEKMESKDTRGWGERTENGREDEREDVRSAQGEGKEDKVLQLT